MKSSQVPNILIVEDDPDQMILLIDLVRGVIENLMQQKLTGEKQRKILKSIGIVKVTNGASLEAAATHCKKILLAIMDCNIPDAKAGVAHDQLVKTQHRITGQHKSVDIIKKHCPDTPITMISSLDRFQKIVSKFYQNEHNISINFIRKSDHSMIQGNVGYYLRQHLRALES